MLHEVTAVVHADTYRIIEGANGVYLVSSKAETGVWHKATDRTCDCKGFANRQTCSHLLALSALGLQRTIAAKEAQLAAMLTDLGDLQEALTRLAAPKVKALPPTEATPVTGTYIPAEQGDGFDHTLEGRAAAENAAWDDMPRTQEDERRQRAVAAAKAAL